MIWYSIWLTFWAPYFDILYLGRGECSLHQELRDVTYSNWNPQSRRAASTAGAKVESRSRQKKKRMSFALVKIKGTLTSQVEHSLANGRSTWVRTLFWWLCRRYILRTLNIDEATAKVLSLGCMLMQHDAASRKWVSGFKMCPPKEKFCCTLFGTMTANDPFPNGGLRFSTSNQKPIPLQPGEHAFHGQTLSYPLPASSNMAMENPSVIDDIPSSKLTSGIFRAMLDDTAR